MGLNYIQWSNLRQIFVTDKKRSGLDLRRLNQFVLDLIVRKYIVWVRFEYLSICIYIQKKDFWVGSSIDETLLGIDPCGGRPEFLPLKKCQKSTASCQIELYITQIYAFMMKQGMHPFKKQQETMSSNTSSLSISYIHEGSPSDLYSEMRVLEREGIKSCRENNIFHIPYNEVEGCLFQVLVRTRIRYLQDIEGVGGAQRSQHLMLAELLQERDLVLVRSYRQRVHMLLHLLFRQPPTV